ncbi:hypothetical protein BK141_23935 [Paenibacillus sp. FSL R5-0765]|nr:hypothetical protein BK141_23935 [Paenibacillus sp. FSL R5-0765]
MLKSLSVSISSPSSGGFFLKTFVCIRKDYNLILKERIESYKRVQETGEKIKFPTPAWYKYECF